MTTNIAQLVNRGLELRRQIHASEEELKTISKALEAIALANPDDHVKLVDEEREGTRWLADGRLPVIFESDMILGTIQDNSVKHKELEALLDGSLCTFADFYKKKTIHEMIAKDGKAFRALATDKLAARAAKFIHAAKARNKDGIAKTRTVIDWDAATATSPAEAV